LIFHTLLLFAFLNLVTGAFCKDASERAAHDQEIVIENHMDYLERYAQDVGSLLKVLVSDGSGTVMIHELEDHLQNQKLEACFVFPDIDQSYTWTLFPLLDADGMGYQNKFRFIQLQSAEKWILHCQQSVTK